MTVLNKNNFLIKLSESPQTSFGKIDFEKQSPAQKVFSSIWAVESEVNNGGFVQYFCNESASTANYIVVALLEIKAPKTAAICEKAITLVFHKGLPTTPELISIDAAKIDGDTRAELNRISDEFCHYPHDLTELLYDFVVLHATEFGVQSQT